MLSTACGEPNRYPLCQAGIGNSDADRQRFTRWLSRRLSSDLPMARGRPCRDSRSKYLHQKKMGHGLPTICKLQARPQVPTPTRMITTYIKIFSYLVS